MNKTKHHDQIIKIEDDIMNCQQATMKIKTLLEELMQESHHNYQQLQNFISPLNIEKYPEILWENEAYRGQHSYLQQLLTTHEDSLSMYQRHIANDLDEIYVHLQQERRKIDGSKIR